MKSIINSFLPALFVCLCIACQKKHSIPLDVRQAIDSSGNVSQLESVIRHYQGNEADSLKLKAAYFLISNMPGWYYYEGELLTKFQDYLKLIRKDDKHGEYYINSFNTLYGNFITDELDKKYDIKEIKAEDLIENIDLAFKVWKEQPWGKHVSFNHFCEYILPYRIGDEVPEDSRQKIYNQYNLLLDSIIENNDDVISACSAVNSNLQTPKWILTLQVGFMPHFQASQLINYKTGNCREMTDLAVYAMRAVGIPVAIDFVPQWPTRPMGHESNAVFDKHGQAVPFMGAESNPGVPHKALDKRGKVYRHTFSVNKNSLEFLQKGQDIPALFMDSRIIDVTRDYAKCHNIAVKLNPEIPSENANTNLVYITVFNNKTWVPIDWGKRKSDKVAFSNMEGDIAYMACYYSSGEGLIPASQPFILENNGDVKYLSLNKSELIDKISLTRIYPVMSGSYVTENLPGATFQGANKPDFSDAETLHTITIRPNPFWSDIPLKNKKKFRYVRYLESQYGEIGELEFYSDGRVLKGTYSGNKSYEKAFDSDIFTSYRYDTFGVKGECAYLSVDFGKQENVNKIRFSPALKDKPEYKITDKHLYTLLCWMNGKWEKLDTEVAINGNVTFANIPSNALYRLQDETGKTDERIFTYEKGKVIFR